jgi:hypothetical protein
MGAEFAYGLMSRVFRRAGKPPVTGLTLKVEAYL